MRILDIPFEHMLPFRPDYTHFIAIADAKSLSRASERVGLGQAALSKSLQRLENELGYALFSRAKTGVTLTQKGEKLYRIVSSTQKQWAALWQAESADELTGILRVGAHQVVAQTTLSYFLGELLSRTPGLFLDFNFDRSQTIARKVIVAEIDVGFVINPPRHPELVIIPLRKEFIGLYESYTRKADERHTRDFLYYNPEMINIHSNIKKYKHFVSVAVPDYSTIAQLVTQKNGVGLLPSSLADQFSSLRLTQQILPSQLCLVYRRDRSKNKLLQEFIGAARILAKI